MVKIQGTIGTMRYRDAGALRRYYYRDYFGSLAPVKDIGVICKSVNNVFTDTFWVLYR